MSMIPDTILSLTIHETLGARLRPDFPKMFERFGIIFEWDYLIFYSVNETILAKYHYLSISMT